MPRSSTLIIIPAWQEEKALPVVLADLTARHPEYDVLVVDDGSRDSTTQCAQAVPGVDVVRLPVNLGVGGAMRAGYRYALRHGYQYTVQLDADGQHDPAALDDVLSRVHSGELDLCIGSRFLGVGDYKVVGPRKWAMKVLETLMSGICGTKLTDTTSGFKACGIDGIRLFSYVYPAEYLGDTLEALVIASKAGLRIGEVGVAMRARIGGTPSHDFYKSIVFLARAVLAISVGVTQKKVVLP
ncbi:MAG: glycosyltransferase family 2 protein [Propionibacteriaceae bacterium]